jgi:hypothetical protein
VENCIEAPQKIINRTAEWSSLGIYLKKFKSGYNKDTCIPVFIVLLFTVAKLWKQHRCPTTDEWIKKM